MLKWFGAYNDPLKTHIIRNQFNRTFSESDVIDEISYSVIRHNSSYSHLSPAYYIQFVTNFGT